MFSLKPVTISGINSQRGSWFNPVVGEVFNPKGLGADTDQDWYERARREIEQFDSYVERLRRLANRQVRENLWSEYVGDPNNSESGAYRRNTVAYHISEADAYSPVNYKIFASDAPGMRVRNRVTKLDSLNTAFKSDLDAAEGTYGLLPEPQIIEKIIEVPVAAPQAAFPTVPVVAVGGLVVVGIVLYAIFH